jgi:hypothetical protein
MHLGPLAGVAVAIAIEAEVVWPDDTHRAGVARPIAGTAVAVIVGGVGVETSALVARVAFAALRNRRVFPTPSLS